MQVAKWGDDLAVRLPTDLVEGLRLKEGDEVEVRVTRAPERNTISEEEREHLLQQLRELRRPFPSGYKFSREEANG